MLLQKHRALRIIAPIFAMVFVWDDNKYSLFFCFHNWKNQRLSAFMHGISDAKVVYFALSDTFSMFSKQKRCNELRQTLTSLKYKLHLGWVSFIWLPSNNVEASHTGWLVIAPPQNEAFKGDQLRNNQFLFQARHSMTFLSPVEN